MKIRFLILMIMALSLCSCKDTIEDVRSTDYSFFIFKYANESYKELIIATDSEYGPDHNPSSEFRVINGIYNYPKLYHNEPYFGRARWSQAPEKYTFDICELATEEKVLPLHGKYYTYFPYTRIDCETQAVLRDGKWEDICSINPKDLPTIGKSAYSEIRFFDIRALEKLTKKKRTEMTIEDMETAVNKLIDHGKLDKYSTKVTGMWQSNE